MEIYKLREEKDGAMLFNSITGASLYLSEEDYRGILGHNTSNFEYLFDNNGNPLFTVFKPIIHKDNLPADCLSAPSKVYLELTRRCNLKCEYCYNNSRKDYPIELRKEQIFNLIDELYEAGTFEIRLTGGEPTLHPDFFEIVKYLKVKDFFISMGTNGVWSDELTQIISESGIRIIIISLDGPEFNNDQSRGKGTFQAITKTIRKLKSTSNITLKINSVLCKENKDHIEEIINLADSLGVEGVNFAPLRVSGRAAQPGYGIPLDPIDMYSVVSKITVLRKHCKVKIQTYFDIIKTPDVTKKFPSSLMNNKSCAAGIEVAAVSPFGEIYGCVVSPANEMEDSAAKRLFTAGNLSEGNFMKVWLDSARWTVYRDLACNKSPKCIACIYYSKSCFGNCVIDSYNLGGNFNTDSPLCFVDLLGNGQPKSHKIGVAMLIVNSDGKVLLQRRDSNSKIKYPGSWVLFGGGKKPNETPKEAIKRELAEELDLNISCFSFFFKHLYSDEEEEHLQYIYNTDLDLDLTKIVLNEGSGIGYFSRDEINHMQLGFKIDEVIEAYFAKQVI